MINRYSEVFDYLSAPKAPTSPEGTVVFGRKDPLVAQRFVDLSGEGLVKWVVITGGKGKDSGDLDIPESEYLAHEAEKYASLKDTRLPLAFLETRAENGAENANFSLDIMRNENLGHAALTAVAHATSLRRLAHMLDHAATQREEPLGSVYRIPSNYSFDAKNPEDQAEALGEMKRLVEWPQKDWLLPTAGDDIPEDLLYFYLDSTKK